MRRAWETATMANMRECSPTLSATSEMTEEELDVYFASYVPLSNLPTPPPAKEQALPKSAAFKTPSQTQSSASTSTSTSTSTRTSLTNATTHDVHASHLANLVPLNVSAQRPHALVIAGFLDRANVPEEVIAFSACILDSLSSRFAASWRDALARSDYARHLHKILRTDASGQPVNVSPDVIVLAALSLAHGWLVDRLRSSKHWSVRESAGLFSVQEIEATKRAILSDMDYGLFRISDRMVHQRLTQMQRTRPTEETAAESDSRGVKKSRSRNLSLSLAGTALWCHGVQTPEPSP